MEYFIDNHSNSSRCKYANHTTIQQNKHRDQRQTINLSLPKPTTLVQCVLFDLSICFLAKKMTMVRISAIKTKTLNVMTRIRVMLDMVSMCCRESGFENGTVYL